MTKVAGVDEAGRGCVIGPLVVAGVLINEDCIDRLRCIGVKDSKELSRKKREALAVEIEKTALKCSFFDLKPRTIDVVVNKGVKLRKLNYLETMAMAKIIRDLNPEKAYVDPVDVIIKRFKRDLLRVLPSKPKIISRKHADALFEVVSAASILAKVRRDNFVARLRESYGDFGSGYCSDRRTIEFLESWFKNNDFCPSFIRSSWSTVKRIRKKHSSSQNTC